MNLSYISFKEVIIRYDEYIPEGGVLFWGARQSILLLMETQTAVIMQFRFTGR